MHQCLALNPRAPSAVLFVALYVLPQEFVAAVPGEPQYFDGREVMHVPELAEFRDRVYVSPQIGWGAKRLLAMHLR